MARYRRTRLAQGLAARLDEATLVNAANQLELFPDYSYALASWLGISVDALVNYRGKLILRWRKGDDVINLGIWVWDSMHITAFRTNVAVELCRLPGCKDFMQSDNESRLKHLLFRHRNLLLALYRGEEVNAS